MPVSPEGHLAAIVQSSSDAIISKDLRGIVRSWNASAQRIFGWTNAEILGRSVRLLIPDERQTEEDEILQRIRFGELVPKFSTVRRHKAGHHIPVAVTVSPIRDPSGRIVGASKIAHHIGDELRIRKELEESEARFRTLADNIPQLAWMADADGWIFWYNRRWYEYTGTSHAEMEGWGWKKVHHPNFVDQVVERIKRSFDTGAEWEDTFPLRGANGDYRWFLSRAKPVFDGEGNVVLWFGTNTDITQQREHETQIELLMGEANHRAKNMISIVQAILRRTSGAADQSFVEVFENRLSALAANQDVLVNRNWHGAAIGDVVRSQLSMLDDVFEERIALAGNNLALRPSAAEALGLAIHELCTNAVKYGALSGSAGRLRIHWQVIGLVDAPQLSFEWREEGGPAVAKPTRQGFGTILITRNMASSIGADVALDYHPNGLVWSFRAPLAQIEAIPLADEGQS